MRRLRAPRKRAPTNGHLIKAESYSCTVLYLTRMVLKYPLKNLGNLVKNANELFDQCDELAFCASARSPTSWDESEKMVDHNYTHRRLPRSLRMPKMHLGKKMDGKILIGAYISELMKWWLFF